MSSDPAQDPPPPEPPPSSQVLPGFDTAHPSLPTPPPAFAVPLLPEQDLVLEPGARPVPGYELLFRLGKGGFGEVWKARGPGGVDVALKIVPLGSRTGEAELRALQMMLNIRHAHLLALSGTWQSPDRLILALELADGTLMDRLKEALRQDLPGIPPDELLGYLSEAAKGIDHLNAIPIQHRDVKPQNLLLVGGSVKVADFGLARLLQHTVTHTSQGGMTPVH